MKKTLSLFLSMIMLITTTIIPASAEDAGVQITAYVTVSRYGEIIDDKNGDVIEWIYTCDWGNDIGGGYSPRNGYNNEE